MVLTLKRSHEPNHIAIDNEKKEVTSGSVGNDGRFKVRFHDDIASVTAWCRRLQRVTQQDQDHARPQKVVSNFGLGKTKEAHTAAHTPRLNIAIHIIGSRGDVQPFIPVAQLLASEPYGHRVRICTHPAFKDFVESQGLEFFSIGGDPEALMAYMVKNPGLLPSRESVKAGDIKKRRGEMWEIINGAWRSCIEAGNGMGERVKAANVRSSDDLFLADAIIANPPSMAHIHCAEKLGIPLHVVFTMPWSPTESFSHPLASLVNGGVDPKTANYLSFIMMELLTWQGLGDLINKFRDQVLGLDSMSPMWGFQLLPRLHVPFTYLWSESMIPKPTDWGPHINITGFSFLPLAKSYTPPPDLVEFLEKGPPPIYIGFGSIVVDNPQALTELLLKAVKLAGVRAIISKGWSKVGGDDVPDDVYLVGNCPHDWLFEHVSAVVHHGGAGTTAAGIAAGRPTVVVPFFGDQPFWGRMVARSGAGPEPIPFKEMTAESLAHSIVFALKPEVQLAAQDMADSIAEENGAADTAQDVEDRLDIEEFRCDICPERLATWKHKKTGAHMSGFAVSCLIDKGLIQPNDVKFLRRRRWYVEEGAEHPAVGMVAAFTGYFTAVATATSDYSRALKAKGSRSKSLDSNMITDLSTDGPCAESARLAPSEVPSHVGFLRRVIPENALTAEEMEMAARKMAKKSLRAQDIGFHHIKRSQTLYDKQKAAWKARERGHHGRLFWITRSTGRYAGELAIASLKMPVAFLYQTANGFHNLPSYSIFSVEVRRRDEITGLGSGLATAGKEFTLGMWDAFSGLVTAPYQGGKEEGVKGVGKGIWRGLRGLFTNMGASVFGLPGYALKGLEKEISKRRLTELKAELLLIRLRQGIMDFRVATPEERENVVRGWQRLSEHHN